MVVFILFFPGDTFLFGTASHRQSDQLGDASMLEAALALALAVGAVGASANCNCGHAGPDEDGWNMDMKSPAVLLTVKEVEINTLRIILL